jgi:quercetin dioxygenase-like cupin family protein
MTARAQGFLAGLAVGFVLAGGVAGTRSAGPRTPHVPPDAMSDSRTVVLENERVRVRDVTFPPGVLEPGMHTHDLAHVGVILTKGTLVFTERGGATERVDFEPGAVGYRGAGVAHQVGNPGPRPMRVIEVELK